MSFSLDASPGTISVQFLMFCAALGLGLVLAGIAHCLFVSGRISAKVQWGANMAIAWFCLALAYMGLHMLIEVEPLWKPIAVGFSVATLFVPGYYALFFGIIRLTGMTPGEYLNLLEERRDKARAERTPPRAG